MGRFTDYHQACRQAYENAEHFKLPFAVFTDTSGAACCERPSKAPSGVTCEIMYPGEQKGLNKNYGYGSRDMLLYAAQFARFAKEHNLDVGDLTRLVRAVALACFEIVQREVNGGEGNADEYRYAVARLASTAGLCGVEIDWGPGINPVFRKNGQTMTGFPFLPDME